MGLQSNANKIQGDDPGEEREGVVGDLLPELQVDTPDEELLRMATKVRQRWEKEKGALEKRQKENEDYWRGKQFAGTEVAGLDRPLMDNQIFVALETFLPIATRQNPEALVEAAPDAKELAKTVQKMLVYNANRLKLKRKIALLTRFWAIYCIGVVKHGWDETENNFTSKVLRPQKLILDPDAQIDELGNYKGELLGEYRTDKASSLIKRFPDREQMIRNLVNENLGTELKYIEWWTDEMVFWTLDNQVLGKAKNPHWNYPSQQPMIDQFGEPQVGPDGMPAVMEVPGYNHFVAPKKPYTLLSVFNLGIHPWDDTGNIEQNLSLQDKINKRIRQIDKNVDNMNSGFVASGTSFTQEEADLAVDALRRGGAIIVPNGDVNAIKRDQAPSLPGEVFSSLMDYRNEVANIFGTRASSPEGLANQETVRGKILARSQDESRIGGGISESIELVSEGIFNWWVQLMAVYYDEPHAALVVGKVKADEWVQLKASDFTSALVVSVKEGSLIPRDPLTTANQAIDLWSAGAISPVDLFERLDDPDPVGMAERLLLWRTDPMALFPNLRRDMQFMQQAAAGGGPQVGPPTPPGNMGTQPQVGGEQAAAIPQAQSSLSQVPLPNQAPADQGMPRV